MKIIKNTNQKQKFDIYKKRFTKLKKFIYTLYLLPKTYFKWYILRPRGNKHSLNAHIVLSLTSYKPRFNSLVWTIRTLIMQTVKADKITLWISHKDKKYLPQILYKYSKYGLEIHFTRDIKSFKKIIPAMKKYPDSYIVTVDDDICYDKNILKKLITYSKQYKQEVIANRGGIIVLDNKTKTPLTYKKWKGESGNNKTPELNFLTGVGGVLYPPYIFHKDVLNEMLFMKLTPKADDVWLWWMLRLAGKKVYITKNNFRYISWPGSQKESLMQKNIHGNQNDKQVKNMIKQYGFPH